MSWGDYQGIGYYDFQASSGTAWIGVHLYHVPLTQKTGKIQILREMHSRASFEDHIPNG